MGSQLQQILRSLCFNTGWKYAVFWKLRHRARMIFTWEDVYYDCDQYLDKTASSLYDSSCAHDPLGLAVAKMSYEVYSLGERIVGQVAISGKHSWISSDMHIAQSSATSEYIGGWQNQFSAGIKTIAVVPVIPHGVVQLGSLHKIAEDLKLVDHIRYVFSELQNSLAVCIPSYVKSNTEDSCLSDMVTRNSDSAGFQEDEMNLWCQVAPSPAKSSNHSQIFPPPGGLQNKVLQMKVHEKAECSTSGRETSLPSSYENIDMTRPEQVMNSLSDAKSGELNDLRDFRKEAEILNIPVVKNVRGDESNLYDTTQSIDGSQTVTTSLPSQLLDSPAFGGQGEFHLPELPSMQLHQARENNFEPFSFGAGYELYEALGASFQKQNNCVWEAESTSSEMAIEISHGMSSGSLLMDNSDMNLLEAVVAKVSNKGRGIESVKLCQDLEESLLTAEKTPCMSLGTISSAGYSFDRDTSSSLNSVTYGVESFQGFSSTSCSRESEHLEKAREPVKISKKRARPGESCRPRPRDRQLIQDRIKELRELVPNGSKCSIDSLLERTIKHMLFLQSITKHAEKLHKCSVSKLLDKETGMRRFSCREQGSSCAVEVGSNSKICPIIVENINVNGQMLVEMLSEECNQFFDIAEIIRGLGLTILKGVSETYGDKMWMCFVVEGQNNRSMHRMDVLWSLMQLFQPKASEVINV